MALQEKTWQRGKCPGPPLLNTATFQPWPRWFLLGAFFPFEIYWLILWKQIKGAAYYKSIKDKKTLTLQIKKKTRKKKISHLPSSPFQFSFMGLLKGESGAGRSSWSPHKCHTCGIPAQPSGMRNFVEPSPGPGDQLHLLLEQD